MPTVALIGGSHIHAPGFTKTLAQTPGIETLYVWDRDPGIAQQRQAVCGGAVIASPAEALGDPALDAVVICGETDQHAELAPPAAAAGKHLFIEKPIGINADHTRRVARAVRDAGVIFQTGFFQRGVPAVQWLRRAALEGTLGKVTRLRLSNCHAGALKGWFDHQWQWMTDPTVAGVGAFGDLGAHALDLLIHLTPGDTVTACTAQIGAAIGRYGDCDEFGEAMLRLASGAVATLAAGWVDHANPNTLEITGTAGHARVTAGQLFVTAPEVAGADGKTPMAGLPEPWPHAFDLFLSAISGARDVPLVPIDEAEQSGVVMDALYAASRQNVWVQPR